MGERTVTTVSRASVQWNPFQYANSAPTNGTDPDGRRIIDDTDGRGNATQWVNPSTNRIHRTNYPRTGPTVNDIAWQYRSKASKKGLSDWAASRWPERVTHCAWGGCTTSFKGPSPATTKAVSWDETWRDLQYVGMHAVGGGGWCFGVCVAASTQGGRAQLSLGGVGLGAGKGGLFYGGWATSEASTGVSHSVMASAGLGPQLGVQTGVDEHGFTGATEVDIGAGGGVSAGGQITFTSPSVSEIIDWAGGWK